MVDPYRDVLISRLTAYKKKLKGILFQSQSVMWPETVGLRTRPSETKKSVSVLVLYTVVLVLVLVLQVWCCVLKDDLVTLVILMILKDAATFQVLFYSFSILCLEHHYCGDQQWRSLT